MKHKRYYTPVEAAEILNLTLGKVLKEIASNRLTSTDRNRQIMVKHGHLMKFKAKYLDNIYIEPTGTEIPFNISHGDRFKPPTTPRNKTEHPDTRGPNAVESKPDIFLPEIVSMEQSSQTKKWRYPGGQYRYKTAEVARAAWHKLKIKKMLNGAGE